MSYTIVGDGRSDVRELGGDRTLAEVLERDERAAVRDGRLVAVSRRGTVLDLSSPLEPGERVELRTAADETRRTVAALEGGSGE